MHVVQIGYGCVGKAVAKAFKDKGVRLTIFEERSDARDAAAADGFAGFEPGASAAQLTDVDAVFISVGTPLDEEGSELCLKQLFSTVPTVLEILSHSPKAAIVLRSTVPPMTSSAYMKELRNGFDQPVAFFYVPEYLRAATAEDDARRPRHIVIGCDEGADPALMLDLWGLLVPSRNDITVMSVLEAELSKLFHNNYNAYKISFFNYCHLFCNSLEEKDSTGPIDTNAISRSIARTCEGMYNPSYGIRSGFPFGGGCLVKDVSQTKQLEERLGVPVPLMGTILEVNRCMEREVLKAEAKA